MLAYPDQDMGPVANTRRAQQELLEQLLVQFRVVIGLRVPLLNTFKDTMDPAQLVTARTRAALQHCKQGGSRTSRQLQKRKHLGASGLDRAESSVHRRNGTSCIFSGVWQVLRCIRGCGGGLG